MKSDENKVPRPLLDRLGISLEQDGFKQAIPGLFTKDLDSSWRAWISVPGFAYALFPTAGVYNVELKKIADAAWLKLGRPSQQPPDSGPPLIMVNLESLIGEDMDCKKRETWDLKVDELDVSDLREFPELTPAVADDLAYCLRQKAYPFFANHTNFQSIWDAACQGMGSPALPNYFPLILIKLGRRDDVMRYVDERLRRITDEKFANDYRAYVQELLELVPA